MKPSEIQEYPNLYNAYKLSLMTGYSNFMDKYIQHTQLIGRDKTASDEMKLKLINVYFEIIMDYLAPTTEQDNSFFTLEQISIIEDKLNILMRTNYTYFKNTTEINIDIQ